MNFGFASCLAQRLVLGAALVSVGGLAACGGPNKYYVTGTGTSASADAHIQVETRETGNKLVTIDIQNLPPPDRVAEDAEAFVVWFSAKDQPTQKAGHLQYDKDERVGKAEATCAYEEFTVLVTAEESVEAGSPSNKVVIRQDVE
jgi:hypothetical protein